MFPLIIEFWVSCVCFERSGCLISGPTDGQSSTEVHKHSFQTFHKSKPTPQFHGQCFCSGLYPFSSKNLTLSLFSPLTLLYHLSGYSWFVGSGFYSRFANAVAQINGPRVFSLQTYSNRLHRFFQRTLLAISVT